MEVDFTSKIKSNVLDKVTYQGPRLFEEKDYQEFKYLDIDIKKLLHMPPPSNSSDQTMAELVEVIKITIPTIKVLVAPAPTKANTTSNDDIGAASIS